MEYYVSEIAKMLGVTPESIYKKDKREDLVSKGYMFKDNLGSWRISTEGYNYLKDKRTYAINRGYTQVSKDIGNQDNKKEEEALTKAVTKPVEATTQEDNYNSVSYIVSLLDRQIADKDKQLEDKNKQIEDLKEEREYYKKLYLEKDSLLNSYINTHLLAGTTPAGEEVKEEQPKKRKGFFSLFNN